MDNLTHALVGAAIGKAGAERTTPLATGTLVLAANAPDIDVLSYTQGEYFALAYRRGITHGIPAMLVLPFVVAGVVLAWDRWIRRRRDPQAPPARAGPILFWSFAGLLTHPALDWMNTYGMRWGLPFDGSWTYGDALFIVDPWIWLVLGGGVFLSSRPDRLGLLTWGIVAAAASAVIFVAPVGRAVHLTWLAGLAAILTLRRLVGDAQPTPRVAQGAVAAAALYIALMVGADLRARGQVLEAARAAGLDVVDLMVQPQPADPFHAEVEVRTADAFVPGAHRWLGGPRVELHPDEAVPLLSGPPDLAPARLREIVEAARLDRDASLWLVWSRYPYVRVAEDGEGWLVRFADARYDGRGGVGGLSGLLVPLDGDLGVAR